MISEVRSFNRTVTERVGALVDGYLGRGRPLGASRVLWELDAPTDVRTLRARLGLDSGYMSRLLRGLEAEGLVWVEVDARDRRGGPPPPPAPGARGGARPRPRRRPPPPPPPGPPRPP